jgi:hypothetical protein
MGLHFFYNLLHEFWRVGWDCLESLLSKFVAVLCGHAACKCDLFFMCLWFVARGTEQRKIPSLTSMNNIELNSTRNIL